MFKGLHTVAQGTVGTAIAIAELAKRGFIVCVPLVDAQDYDLIADDGIRLHKVQVKTSQMISRGKYVVQLKRVHHNKTRNEIRRFDSTKVDILFVACNDGSMYLIPSSEVKSTCSVSMGENMVKWRV